MPYLRISEKPGDVLVNLDGIRLVQDFRTNHRGEHRPEGGVIIYDDNHRVEVSTKSAVAIQAALESLSK